MTPQRFFPFWFVCRGGIVFWADSIGSGYICTRLKKWEEVYGSFFKPSRFLEKRAMKGMPLVRALFTSSIFFFCSLWGALMSLIIISLNLASWINGLG